MQSDSRGSVLVVEDEPTIAEVADQIEHVRKVAGVDHVGIGGDFDGITENVVGLEDVSTYPALFAELVHRGWSDRDLGKLANGNVLRVLGEAERVAARPWLAAVAVTAGTTTYTLAHHLAQVPDITVVTNSVPVANVFFEADLGQTVLLTGGHRTVSDALVGPVAVAALHDLHVDVLFMGVHGMDISAGFTTPNLMEADTNRAMVAAAGRLVVVADHTKWGIVGLSRIARLQDASVLVTDSGISSLAREALADRIGEVVIAPLGAALRGTP